MSQLATLLRGYFERSSYKSIAALARATQAHSPISHSYLKQILRGDRLNPSYDKLVAIAQALDLSCEETNRLLEVAGLPTLVREEQDAGRNGVSPDHQAQQVMEAFSRLRRIPDLPAETLQAVVNGFLLLVEGARVTAGARVQRRPNSLPAANSVGAEGQGDKQEFASTPLLLRPSAQKTSLGPGESLVDDLLGEILSRSGDHPLDTLFLFLEEAAREKGWEIKRRIAEALPQLVELQPEATLRLAALLREDFHFDYQGDIRRRVVEAVPALYRYRPKEAQRLLTFREKDEIYTAMAIVEALHDLESIGLITAATSDRYFAALQLEEPAQEEVITYLHRLLYEAREKPASALMTMRSVRDQPENLLKICVLRTAPRLLKGHPHQVLDLMAHFVRRGEDGAPAEHKNVRRPVAKALPAIVDLLAEASPDASTRVRPNRRLHRPRADDSASTRKLNPATAVEPLSTSISDKAGRLFQTLAQDPDLHVRRAVGDSLARLAVVSSELAMGVLETLIHDQDPYVRQRAGRALLKLADLYPEQAHAYYVALLTSAA